MSKDEFIEKMKNTEIYEINLFDISYIDYDNIRHNMNYGKINYIPMEEISDE